MENVLGEAPDPVGPFEQADSDSEEEHIEGGGGDGSTGVGEGGGAEEGGLLEETEGGKDESDGGVGVWVASPSEE